MCTRGGDAAPPAPAASPPPRLRRHGAGASTALTCAELRRPRPAATARDVTQPDLPTNANQRRLTRGAADADQRPTPTSRRRAAGRRRLGRGTPTTIAAGVADGTGSRSWTAGRARGGLRGGAPGAAGLAGRRGPRARVSHHAHRPHRDRSDATDPTATDPRATDPRDRPERDRPQRDPERTHPTRPASRCRARPGRARPEPARPVRWPVAVTRRARLDAELVRRGSPARASRRPS